EDPASQVPWGAPAVAPDGTVVVAADNAPNPVLEAHNPTDGSLLWSWSNPGVLAGGTPSAVAIDANGTVYFTSSGQLWAVDPPGVLRWVSAPAGYSQFSSTPVIRADGTIVAAFGAAGLAGNVTSGVVAAFDTAGLLLWSVDLC